MVAPADWEEVRLGEHSSFFKGNGLSKAQLIDDGPHPCVHYGELFTHYGSVIETVTSNCVEFDGSFKSLAGDVLMPGSDVTPKGLATASAIKVSDVVLGGDIIVIRSNPLSFHGPFLSNFIRINRGRVLRLVKGSTVYHIHAKDLADLKVLKPTLREQEAIAGALSDADKAIESLDALIAKKRDVKQAAMQQLLTGRTRLPGFTGGWEEVRLGDLAEIVSGGTPSTAIGSYWHGEIPWCTPTDITSCKSNYLFETKRSITPAGLAGSAATLLPAGSLLLCTRATVGDVRIAGRAIATNQGFKSLIVNNQANLKFIYFVLQTLRKVMIEKSSGSTFLELGKTDLSNIAVLVPLLKEQEAIGEALSAIDDELEVLTDQVSKIRKVREGMMQNLLTGKVRLV